MRQQSPKCGGRAGQPRRMEGRILGVARCSLLALLTAFAGVAFCQFPSQYASQASRLMAYDRLFIRVMWLEDEAAKLASQGKDNSFLASQIARDYGLTAAAQAVVTAVAADWRVKHGAIQNQAKPLLASGQNSASSAELQALLAARLKVTSDHIDQLQADLGRMRFAAMDALVTKPPSVEAPPGRTASSADVKPSERKSR